MGELARESVPIEDDAAYWRQMYEERVALQDAGFTALLAERDRYRDALREILVEIPKQPHIDAGDEAMEIAEKALNG